MKKLNEDYARLMKIMMGEVPDIKQFGILTAHNPMGKKLSAEDNNIRNAELKRDLNRMGFGYHGIRGKFDNMEKTFFVPFIMDKEVIELGGKYGQKSVIYGEKDKDGFVFSYAELIYKDGKTVGHKVTGETRVFRTSVNADNFYSEIRGRKFLIPFEFEAIHLSDYPMLSENIEHTTVLKPRGKRDIMFFFDSLYPNAKFIDGKIEDAGETVIPDVPCLNTSLISEYSEYLYLAEIKHYEAQLQNDILEGRNKWEALVMLNSSFRELRELVYLRLDRAF